MNPNQNEQEIEIKLYVLHPESIRWQLKQFGALLIQPRTFENNLRFDSPEGSLSAEHRVLRLRQDRQTILTYKGPGKEDEDVSVRQEIEILVDDFERTRRFLEALGYQVYTAYEKYRTVYRLEKVLVTIDELPIGNFIEIEGPDAETIHDLADRLGLKWDTRIKMSYLVLFDLLKESHPDLAEKHLRFSDLEGMHFTAQDLGIQPADD